VPIDEGTAGSSAQFGPQPPSGTSATQPTNEDRFQAPTLATKRRLARQRTRRANEEPIPGPKQAVQPRPPVRPPADPNRANGGAIARWPVAISELNPQQVTLRLGSVNVEPPGVAPGRRFAISPSWSISGTAAVAGSWDRSRTNIEDVRLTPPGRKPPDGSSVTSRSRVDRQATLEPQDGDRWPAAIETRLPVAVTGRGTSRKVRRRFLRSRCRLPVSWRVPAPNRTEGAQWKALRGGVDRGSRLGPGTLSCQAPVVAEDAGSDPRASIRR
jgi:hypothetical protein